MSDGIASIMSLTGASFEVAQRVLEVAGGDAAAAVSLYFDDPSMFSSGGGGRGGAPKPAVPRPGGDYMDDFVDVEDDKDVRAPIPQRREVLMAPSMPPFIARQSNLMHGEGDFPPGIPVYHAQPRSQKSWTDDGGKLQDMFKKPRDVSFKGSFNEAQRQADKKGQWLVISVYMHGEFPCDMQNRDLWSDENVKSFLRDNCIFMQLESGTDDGDRFIRLYPPTNYPYIAILDPRTGELVQSYDFAMMPAEFFALIPAWIAEHALDDDLNNRIAKRQAAESEVFGLDSPQATAATVDTMTEDEQLQAALAASMNDLPPKAATPQPAVAKAAAAAAAVASPPQTAKLAVKPVARHPVTAKDAGFTRLQVRMTDGSKKVYGFLKTDAVAVVYQHIKADVPELANVDFELMMHTDKTSDKLSLSIDDAKMANASLNLVV